MTMDRGSLLSILLSTRKRLSHWTRIKKWQCLTRRCAQGGGSRCDDWDCWDCSDGTPRLCSMQTARNEYSLFKRGFFWCFQDARLYHTAQITGRLPENAWLRMPWDVWKLVLRHVPNAASCMLPVCSYFARRLKSGVDIDDNRCCMLALRTAGFKPYVPRVSKKRTRAPRHGFSTRESPTPLYISHILYFNARHRVRKPIVTGKRFQEFEWRPN